jgi:hypothetical protein
MLLKNKTTLNVTIGERDYVFDCEATAPLGEIYDALNQMRGFVVDRIVEAEEARRQGEEDAAAVAQEDAGEEEEEESAETDDE